MKPTSPLSLLLFIRLVSSSPIALSHKTHSSTSCGSEGCREPFTGPSTPPTRIATPHFPEHQLSSPSSDIIIDNHPITPTSKTFPVAALDAERPLTSAFLLSLGQTASPTTPQLKDEALEALPSKPSSEIPSLRKADVEKYLALLTVEISESEDVDSSPVAQATQEKHCGMGPKAQRIRQNASYIVQEYTDVIVIVIVLSFLALVLAVEAVERCGSVRSVFDKNTHHHGAIFLVEKDTEKALCDPSETSSQATPIQ